MNGASADYFCGSKPEKDPDPHSLLCYEIVREPNRLADESKQYLVSLTWLHRTPSISTTSILFGVKWYNQPSLEQHRIPLITIFEVRAFTFKTCGILVASLIDWKSIGFRMHLFDFAPGMSQHIGVL